MSQLTKLQRMMIELLPQSIIFSVEHFDLVLQLVVLHNSAFQIPLHPFYFLTNQCYFVLVLLNSHSSFSFIRIFLQ
jgi:hypothetical protein